MGFCVNGRTPTLLAYLDEIGEPGAFVTKSHARFNTSPAFGYAGLVIPAEAARAFGQEFTIEKRKLFKREIEASSHPSQWERKGASMFRPTTPTEFPQYLRVYRGLVRSARRMGGMLFYYADEKPLGTPAQTSLNATERETAAMRETLNRLCTYAERKQDHLMVLIDSINEKTRSQRLPNMYGHILSRAAERNEMKRIIEPPMHVDSTLSANIQFADWTAAALSRAVEYQVIRQSDYEWVPDQFGQLAGAFTFESKIHLRNRSVADLNRSEIVKRDRHLFPPATGQLVLDGVDPDTFRKMHAAAERSRTRKRK